MWPKNPRENSRKLDLAVERTIETQRAEIERLRARLHAIESQAIACTEPDYVAVPAKLIHEQSSPTRVDSMEQGGISDRLSNFDEWGDRIRDKS